MALIPWRHSRGIRRRCNVSLKRRGRRAAGKDGRSRDNEQASMTGRPSRDRQQSTSGGPHAEDAKPARPRAEEPRPHRIGRRSVLKTGWAWTACAIAAPLPVRARGEQPVKIGMVEPVTGVYAALAEGE